VLNTLVLVKAHTLIAAIIAGAAALACTKDRDLPERIPVPINPELPKWHTIAINEFLATGNQFVNEFGKAADWIEIYNPGSEPVKLDGVNWYLTDDANMNPDKFRLPAVTIPPLGFLLVWADNEHNNPAATDIHANFALSMAGEQLGIYFHNDGERITIDRYDYGPQEANVSEGRSPDGSPNWVFFTTPTPGAPNP
jgi:hypothetical protein